MQLIHALLIVTYLVVYTVLLSAATLAPTVAALLGDPGTATVADAAELFLFEDRVWPLALILIIACGAHSVFMSHRVFGPLVRVRREAGLIGEGDLTRRVRFRKNDHMTELRDALNAMVESLDRKMGEVHLARARCSHRLEQLEQGLVAGDTEERKERKQRLAALQRDFLQLERRLQGFRTSQRLERLRPGESTSAAPHASQSPNSPQTPESSQEGRRRWDDPASGEAASA